MIPALCLLASIGILAVILRYRVHVHVTYTPRVSGRPPRAGKTQRAGMANFGGGSQSGSLGKGSANGKVQPLRVRPRSTNQPESVAVSRLQQNHTDEIVSALRNLGCSATQARAAADRAIADGTAQDFETFLRKAIQYATQGKAA